MRPGVTSLLVEVEYAESVGDEGQASEEEDLGWLKDGWNPHPGGRECGELQRAETNRIARARHGGGGGKMGHLMTKRVLNVQRPPHGRRQLSVQNVTNLVNICSLVVRCDRRWPSTQ